MTILEMLNRLAEKAPDVCKKDAGTFIINEYVFSHPYDMRHPQLMARHKDDRYQWVFGRPALAWLADAIMAECEKQKISLECASWTYDDKPLYRVCDIVSKDRFVSTCNYAEALLATFLAAVEER